MEVLLGIVLFAGFIFLIIFPIICFSKLRSINDKLSEIEYRINLLHIKNPKEEKPVTAPVLVGMTDYIFYDASMYFMFFTVFGLGSALLRIAKREHYDRISYYSEMDKNASAIDVGISSNL